MKDLLIIKSPADLHELFQLDWIQDYRATNTKLPNYNFPLAMHFDHANKKFELKEMTDEKFSLSASTLGEFIELMSPFDEYDAEAEYDASKLNYPVVVHFDCSNKSYKIEETKKPIEDNAVSSASKKSFFKKNWQWFLIGAVALVILGTVIYAVL